MKLKGTKEQVELATKIQSVNLDIVEKMIAAVTNKDVWPEEKDDKEGNEVRKRYRAEALEALELLKKELKNTEAAFYLKGELRPILDLEGAMTEAQEADRAGRGKADFTPSTPQIELYKERLETVFAHMTKGKEYTYMKKVPEYSFGVN